MKILKSKWGWIGGIYGITSAFLAAGTGFDNFILKIIFLPTYLSSKIFEITLPNIIRLGVFYHAILSFIIGFLIGYFIEKMIKRKK